MAGSPPLMARTHSSKWPGDSVDLDVGRLRAAEEMLSNPRRSRRASRCCPFRRPPRSRSGRRRAFASRAICSLSGRFHSRIKSSAGKLPPSYQVNLTAGRQEVAGNSKGDDRPLGIAVLVVARGLGLDRRRIAQVEPHERHVHRVAGHVAQGPGAEVPPAAPGERVIAVGVRPHRAPGRATGPSRGSPGGSASARAAGRPAARSGGSSRRAPP